LGNVRIAGIPNTSISWNLLNVSTRSHMHTWHSGPLGKPCTTYTPEYMASRSMPYKPAEYHYTYVPCPISGNVGIPIRLAQSIIHHNAMHGCCFVYVSLPAGYNLSTCFWCEELWTTRLTLDPPIEAPNPRAPSIPRSNNPLVSGATTLWLVYEAPTF
jgi:hypothetical protein